MECDYLVVGAGFFGSVIAERIANDLNASVILIDKRSHISGNCYSECDPETGIEYHKYGTHTFHTSSEKAWRYITRFAEFNSFHLQIQSSYKGRVYQLPVNLKTINAFYNVTLTPTQAQELIQQEIKKEGIDNPRNFEEVAIASMGRPLYEALIKGYSIKQWGIDPAHLPAKIISRLPVRYNFDDNYFKNSKWQGIPFDGYTKVFERILASERIKVVLDCDYFEHKESFKIRKKTIYSGPIDKYFGFKYGELGWRTVTFEKAVKNVEEYLGVPIMNFPDVDIPYTRIHEPRYLHPERTYPKDRTVIFYERSAKANDNPYYPINTDEDKAKFQQYRALADQEKDVIFGGRLGSYAYLDMDKTILLALKCYEEEIVKERV